MSRVPSKGWTTSLAIAGLIAAAGVIGVMVVAQRDTGGEIVAGDDAGPVTRSIPPVAPADQGTQAAAEAEMDTAPPATPADQAIDAAEEVEVEPASPEQPETAADAVLPRGPADGAGETADPLSPATPVAADAGVDVEAVGAEFADSAGVPSDAALSPADGPDAAVADAGIPSPLPPVEQVAAPDAVGTGESEPMDGSTPAGSEAPPETAASLVGTIAATAQDAPPSGDVTGPSTGVAREPGAASTSGPAASAAAGAEVVDPAPAGREPSTPGVAAPADPAQRPAAPGDELAALAPAEPTEGPDLPVTSRRAEPDMVPPSFDVVRIGPDGGAVFAGRAAPGASVSVRAGDQVVGRAVADRRGEWVILPDAPLDPGSRELGIVSEISGQAPLESTDVVVMMVPDRQQPEESMAGAAPVIAVEVPRDGSGPSRLLQFGGPERGLEAAAGLTLDTIDYDESGRLDFSGKAQPHSTVDAYLNNKLIGRAQTAENGRWRIRPMTAIPAGMHQLRVDQLDTTGKVISRIETPFSQADLARPIPRDGVVIVQPGNSLWRIARNIYGQGVQYTLIYDANAYQIGDPDLIYPGQVFVLPDDQEG